MRKKIEMNKELDNILLTMYHKKILIELDELVKILSSYDIIIEENILEAKITKYQYVKYPCFRLVLSRKNSRYYSYFLYFCFYNEKYILIQGLEGISGGEVFLTEFNSKLEEELPDDFTPHYPTKPPLAIVVDYGY